MLASFVIMLREGFEAFLIVAIVLAYLRKIDRGALVPAARWGIAVAVVVSGVAGWLLKTEARSSLWEGILGLVSVPLVLGLVIHMWRAGPGLKGRLERHLTRSSSGTSAWATVGVFFFTLLMIAREGMETALMLVQVDSPDVLPGAVSGLAGAGLMAWAWSRYGHRINVRRFFQVTGIFLILFLVQVTIYAFHELSESGVLMNAGVLRFHMLTEPFSPEGRYGRWFPMVMVAIPALWLAGAALRDRLARVPTDTRSDSDRVRYPRGRPRPRPSSGLPPGPRTPDTGWRRR